jgi:DNA-binding MarR family transcriptional regulator
MSILIGLESAEFVYLKEKTNATSGNLSLQIDKLSKAGYIKIQKGFKGNYPVTLCKVTVKGIKAFRQYAEDLKSYLETERE